MATSDTRQLQLQISASAELLIRNLKTADNAVAQFQRQADGRLSAIDARFAALGALKGKLSGLDTSIGIGDLAAGATGVTLVALAKRGLDYASSLGEVSQQLGVTTRDYQVYSYAATQVGLSQEEMDKGLQKLTLTLGKAQLGAEGPTKALSALGISLDQIKGKTAGEVIPLIADGLAKISDPAKRAALEVELLGRAGQKMDTLLSGGSGQIDELARAAEGLGLVLSDEQIQSADATADKLAEVKKVLEANVASVVANNAGAILSLANAFGALTTQVIRFTSQNPEAAFAALGAVVGGRVGGPVGATLGATGGYAIGRKIKLDQADGNLDLNSRRRALAGALREQAAAERRSTAAPGLISIRKDGDARSGATVASARAETARQRKLLAQAEAAAKRPRPVPLLPVDADTPSIFAPAGPKPSAGPKGKTAEQIRREQESASRKDRNEKRRADDLLDRANVDLADARADASADPEERLRLERERIDLARQGRDRDLEEQAIDNRYIAANLDRLKSINLQTAEIDKQLLNQRRAQEAEQDAFDTRRAEQDDALALAQIQSGLTIIARDRRVIERRILALRQQEEREALERIANDKNNRYSPAERDRARGQLERLPEIQAAETQALARDQQGPLDQYREQLIRATGDMNEALQGVAANGLASVEDGFVGIISGTESVASAFKRMASSIVADLVRIIVQRAILKSLGGSFLGLGLADGGPVLKLASGGAVSGAGGPREDRIPAMLSNGEYVINAASTARHLPLIEAINAGRLPRFADGGGINVPSARAFQLPALGSPSSASGGASIVRLMLDEGLLKAVIQRESTGVAIEVVKAAAPALVDRATTQTVATLNQPRL